MRQVLQRLDTGQVEIRDVPVPEIGAHQLLVETRATLISAGTERMLVEFGRSGLLGKARSQPERVRQVIDKIRTDGLWPTLDAVRSKLKDPLPLGYCHAGIVRKVGASVTEFRVGDRVATNGPHAEWVRVPRTLAARIPGNVPDEAACFVPLAAVALQGIRLAEPTLGESVVVIGLGLVGLLSVQLLRANGCRVIGIDPSSDRRELAHRCGALVFGDGTDPIAAVLEATDGRGADAALLTLASKSNEPVNQAAAMTRRRGRLVLVGVTGLELDRDPFFRKEISFTVSCSYGPGRYDSEYEGAARDYPAAYVRWTAQRNFVAVLDQMSAGTVDPVPLITHRIPIGEAGQAYDVITRDSGCLGVVLAYEGSPDGAGVASADSRTIVRPARARTTSGLVAGVIGAGNYARRTLLPVLRSAGFEVKAVVSNGGLDATLAADQVQAERVSSDVAAVLDDPAIEVVFVLTRHDAHAELTRRALRAGKHVFVEKPLALSEPDVDEIAALAADSPGLLTVGFNRRFAPITGEVRRRVAGRAGPLSLLCVVNAGSLPRDHWTQSPDVGGGRIVGEACHFIDLARCLAGSPIDGLAVSVALDRSRRPVEDVAHLVLRFEDGSLATIAYLANGARAYPKETITCSFDGSTCVIENWRRLREFGRATPLRLPRRMDKGHAAEVAAWAEAIRQGQPPIPYEELFEVSRWAVRAGIAARAGGSGAAQA